MNRRLQHHAVLRGADVGPPQLVFGGDLALDEFADLVVGLAQILGDVADHILVDLNDLQFGFGDLALGLRARRNVLRPLAGSAGPRRAPAWSAASSAPDAYRRAREPRPVPFPPARFPGLWPSPARSRPAISSFNCVMRSRNCAFCPIRRMTRTSNSLVSLAMTFLTSGSSARSSSIRGNTILSRPCCSASSRAARAHRAVEVLGDDREARLGDGVVEPHHHVAGLDEIAVAREHFADDAAGRMLHFLDVRIRRRSIPARSRRPRSRAVDAQPPSPPASTTTTASPMIRCSRIDRRAPCILAAAS